MLQSKSEINAFFSFVHAVAERHCVRKLNNAVIIDDCKFELSVVESFYVDKQLPIDGGLVNKRMVQVGSPLSAFRIRDMTLALFSCVHEDVSGVDLHFIGVACLHLFSQEDAFSQPYLVLETVLHSHKLDFLELVPTFTLFVQGNTGSLILAAQV